MVKKIPGILLCAVLGGASFFLAKYIPIGGVTIAIILGMITGNLIRLPQQFTQGISFAEKKILTGAIALTGIGLNYKILADLGWSTLAIIVIVLPMTVFTAILLGKAMKMERDFSLLIGIGNAVCGSSAIAAAQGIIKTDEKNVGLSIATINFLGTVGIFLLPTLARLILKFGEIHSGILIGNTLQAIGQVSAAGYSVGEKTGEIAVIVKMCRILMITPIVLILSFIPRFKPVKSMKEMRQDQSTTENTAREHSETGKNNLRNKFFGKGKQLPVPLYILIFILLSIIASLNIIPKEVISWVKLAGKILLTIAMSGIGLKISIKDLLKGGKDALLVGTGTWIIQIGLTILLLILIKKIF